MYIPGRRRTGSSPSRTVMSFAVYVAWAIVKKALQIRPLRAQGSVSERTVGSGVRETLRGRSRDQFPQLFVADLSRQRVRSLDVLGARFAHTFPPLVTIVRSGLGQLSDGEAQLLRRGCSCGHAQPS